MFFAVALSIWTLLNAYVFWRLGSVPWIATRTGPLLFWGTAVFLWSAYPIARILSARRLDSVALPLEGIAAFWIGLCFLLFCGYLTLDALTLGGPLFSHRAGLLRGAVALAALVLSAVALVQWLRPPAIRSAEIPLRNLPRSLDGRTAALVSDLHLGTLHGARWAADTVDRINGLKADLILIAGDTIDGDVDRVRTMVPTLARLSAPLGVWAVAGNHDHYAGLGDALALHEAAGFRMLQGRWAEPTPGLIVAGIDDLTAARQRGGAVHNAVARALADAPPGRPVILLSHTPLDHGESTAPTRIDLVLSGHTHGGQVWPFNLLVKLRHPHVAGFYRTGPTLHLVTRGTGTWGPPMRLWRRGEIWKLTLRAEG